MFQKVANVLDWRRHGWRICSSRLDWAWNLC